MAQQPYDPNDRYSDKNLDPFEDEASKIFNTPDMQRLDRKMDQTAKIEGFRNRLNEEFDRLEDKRSDRLEKKFDARDDQRKAESAEHQAVANQTYPGRQTWKQRIFASGTKKRNMLVGGISGGIIGIFLAFFGFISPFRIPSVMQVVSDTAGQYVERITVKRAKVVMARAIFTEFGIRGGPVITGDGVFSSLMATIRENKFEEKIKARGLEPEYNSDGSVRIKKNGNYMPGNFKNPQAMLEALESDQLTNKIINDLVKEEIPTWRWFKRAKFANWIRIKYDVKRFGIPSSDEKDTAKKKEEMRKAQLKEAYDRTATNGSKFVECLSDASACTGRQSQVSDMAQGNKAEKESGLKTMIDESAAEVTDEASKAAANTAEKFTGRLASKVGLKSVAAIPVVGWIIAVVDMSADINHVARTGLNAIDQGDPIGQIPAVMRGRAYAQMYADWNGYGDQIKNGSMDNDFHALLSTQMEGVESSRALSCRTADAQSVASIFTGAVANAASTCDKGIPIKNKINIDQPSELKKLYEDFSKELGFNAKYLVTAQPTSLVLEGWYQTIGSGGLSGWASDKAFELVILAVKNSLGAIILNALTPDSAKSAATQWMAEITAKIYSKLLDFAGLSVDPLEAGAELMNIIDAGGIFSFRDACIDLYGCHDIAPSVAAKQSQEMAAERIQDDLNKGWLYAAFSPDSTNSITSQLAIALPSSLAPQQFNLTEGTSKLASIVASTPARLMGIVAPSSSAHTYYDHYGMNPKGATDEELAQDLAKETLEKDAECAEVEENTVLNLCKTDKAVIDSMFCHFNEKDPRCNFINNTTGAGGEFRIATFNLLGAIHTSRGNAKDRLDRAFKIMRDNSFSVVGLQEVDKLQYEEIAKLAKPDSGEYGMYPNSGYTVHDGHRNAIIWRTDKFTQSTVETESGTKPFKYFDGEDEQYPFVTLIDNKTKQKIIVFNTHDPTSSPSRGNQSKWRVYDAKEHLKNMEEKQADGTPVFMTGDFNSAFTIRNPEDNGLSRDELTYCIMTSTGTISNAYDVFKKRSGKCPTTKPEGSGSKIDHIYLTTGVQVTNWQKIDDSDVDFATDHPVVFADIIIPGSGTGNNSGEDASAQGFVWPIAKADYPGVSNCFSKPPSGHTGIDIPVPSNTAVRAAKGGKVITANKSAAAGGDAGKSIVIDHGGGYWTNYQHLNNVGVNEGQTVAAGEEIGKSGSTGYSFGPHLHFSITNKAGIDSRSSVSFSLNPIPFLPKDRKTGSCT